MATQNTDNKTVPASQPNSNQSNTKNESDQNVDSKHSPEKKTVEVPKEVLENILDRLEQYQSKVADLEQAQKEYEQTASQDQILKIEKLRASGKLVKSVRLNYYDNKLVLSWQSIMDDVYVETGTGKEIALQKTRLTYVDGTTQEMAQIEFARRKMQRQYEVIKEGKDRDGNMLYTVIMEGGKEVEIDGRFVN